MERRNFLSCITGVTSILVYSKTLKADTPDKLPETPNILFIMTDQHRTDYVSAYNSKKAGTPAIDSIAENGTIFTNAYSSTPLCIPARTAIQTGLYPHQTGAIDNTPKANIPEETLPSLFQKKGYKTVYYGKFHVAGGNKNYKYDIKKSAGSKEKIDLQARKDAVKFLSSKPKSPFFLTVSFRNPHDICQWGNPRIRSKLPEGNIGLPPEKESELPSLPHNFKPADIVPEGIKVYIKSRYKKQQNWTDIDWKKYIWGYPRMCEKVDREIAQVLEALKKAKLEKDTIIVFLSDHGEMLGSHKLLNKRFAYEESAKVPFIISWKGLTKPGNRSNIPVNTGIDLMATLFDFANIPLPADRKGISLKPVVFGKKIPSSKRDFIVVESLIGKNKRPLYVVRMLRIDKYKYIVYDKGKNREELFDIKNDPGEMKNLINDPEYRKQLELCRKTIRAWAVENDDKDFLYV